MRMKKFAAALLGVLALAASSPDARAEGGAPQNLVATGDFDFYILTLSWSPGFCDTGGSGKSLDQCAVGSGEGFVVHGLWPENRTGPYPQDCGQPGLISSAAMQETHGLYPDEGLARHEYDKHGTCTGLSPENYFAAVKYARDQFVIPDQLKSPREQLATSPSELERAFMAVNANLTADNMAVTCERGELVDVRFCVSKGLSAFVNCPKVSGHSCHSRSISVSPLR